MVESRSAYQRLYPPSKVSTSAGRLNHYAYSAAGLSITRSTSSKLQNVLWELESDKQRARVQAFIRNTSTDTINGPVETAYKEEAKVRQENMALRSRIARMENDMVGTSATGEEIRRLVSCVQERNENIELIKARAQDAEVENKHRILHLTQERTHLQKELESLQEQLAREQARNDALTSDLRVSETAAEARRQDLERLSTRCADYEETVIAKESLQETISTLSSRSESIELRIDVVAAERDRAVKEMELSSLELRTCEARNKDLEAKLEETEKVRYSAENALKLAQNCAKTLESERASLQHQLHHETHLREEAEKRAQHEGAMKHEADTRDHASKVKVDELESRLHNQTFSLRSKEAELSSKIDECRVAERKRSSAEKARDDANARLIDVQQRVVVLEERNKHMEQQMQNAVDRMRISEQERTATKDAIALRTAEQALERARSENSERMAVSSARAAESRCRELESEVLKKVNEIDRLSGEVKSLTLDLNSVRRVEVELRDSLAKSSRELMEVRSEVREKEAWGTAAVRRATTLEGELAAARTNLESSLEQVDGHARAARSALSAEESAAARARDLEDKLKAREIEVQSLKTALTTAGQSVHRLTAENDTLRGVSMRLDATLEQLEGARKHGENLTQEIKQISSEAQRYRAIASGNEALRTEVTELTRLRNAHELELLALRSEIETKGIQVKTLAEEKELILQEKFSLASQLRASERARTEASDSLSKSDYRLRSLDMEVEKRDLETSSMANRLKTAERRVEEVEAQLETEIERAHGAEHLHKKLIAANAEIRKLRKMLDLKQPPFK